VVQRVADSKPTAVEFLHKLSGNGMPRTIRFHLDENCDPAIAAGLRRHGIDVTTTADAGLIRACDEDQVAYGIASGRVIFTQDQDILRLHAAGTPHAGIGYCRQNTWTIGEIIDELRLIAELLDPQEMENRLEFL
jgi:predicted nuclease of predicted toxin-antitoxin system